MAVTKVSMDQWLKHQHRIAKEFIPAAKRGCYSAALRSVELMVEETRRAPPANPAGKGEGGAVNTGDYLRSWKAEKASYGARYYNDRSYAAVIEWGRRAGRKPPPKIRIEEWARRRLGLNEKEAKRAAYPIARAISRRGLVGRRIMEDSSSRVADIAVEEIDREIQAELRKP